MIPYELDPSLYCAPPSAAFWDDGFSAAAVTQPDEAPMPGQAPAPANPTRLPIEPEFDAPEVPAIEPENPASKPPMAVLLARSAAAATGTATLLAAPGRLAQMRESVSLL